MNGHLTILDMNNRTRLNMNGHGSSKSHPKASRNGQLYGSFPGSGNGGGEAGEAAGFDEGQDDEQPTHELEVEEEPVCTFA